MQTTCSCNRTHCACSHNRVKLLIFQTSGNCAWSSCLQIRKIWLKNTERRLMYCKGKFHHSNTDNAIFLFTPIILWRHTLISMLLFHHISFSFKFNWVAYPLAYSNRKQTQQRGILHLVVRWYLPRQVFHFHNLLFLKLNIFSSRPTIEKTEGNLPIPDLLKLVMSHEC